MSKQENERIGPMSDEEARAQTERLIKFIKDTSVAIMMEESNRANDESEEEKNKIIKSNTKKLENEYRKKENQVLLKAKIANSNSLNEVRMKKLKAQQELIENAFNEAKKKLVDITKRSDYPQLLKKLILQALVHIEEKSVSLYCNKNDLEIVKKVLPEALEEYKNKWIKGDDKECKVKISSKRHIDCSGGVLLTAKGGKIYCDNTLDVRLVHAYEVALPKLRNVLFS